MSSDLIVFTCIIRSPKTKDPKINTNKNNELFDLPSRDLIHNRSYLLKETIELEIIDY